jgi:hypothetical protein
MRLPEYRRAAQREYRTLLAYVKRAQHETRDASDGDSGQ